jgi:outer membrane protein TolC
MKRFLCLFLALLFSSSLFAEKINWQQISQQTLQNNPSIQTAKLKLDNAKQSYHRAIGGYLPDISLRGSASQGATEGNFARSYSYGLNASLSVFAGFETYNELRTRSAELKAAQADYDRTVSDAAYEAAAQYLNLMWAYETVELTKQIKDRRNENKDMIQLKYNSGNVDIGSLKRVEADVETVNYDLRKAQRSIETVSAALVKAIGKEDNAVLETQETLDIFDTDLSKPDFEDILNKIPEFLKASYTVESVQAQSAKTKSQWLPSINLSGSLSNSDNQWTPDKKGWDAGISISYPLFTGGKRYADTQIAINQLKIAQENLKGTRSLLRYQAVYYYNAFTDAYENIAVRKNYLEASKLQAEISQRKYVNGLTTYQDWYSIENDYINSQKVLLDAKKAAALEKAKWHNFTGEGFDTLKPAK